MSLAGSTLELGAGTVTVHGEQLEWARVGPRGNWGFRTAGGTVLARFHR